MAEKKTFADRKYDKRIPYKPSPESKKMAEDYVAPAIATGMSLLPLGGPASRGMGLYRGYKAGKALQRAVGAAKQGAGKRFAVEGAKEAAKKKALTTPQKVAVAGGATGVAVGGYYGAKGLSEARKAVAKDKPKPMSTASVQESYQQLNRKHGTQRPVTEQTRTVPTKIKTRPEGLGTKKVVKKSATRIAFEKEFAKARKAGKKEFTFRGGKYKSYNTKLAKG